MLLSPAGRLILVNSVLDGLPTYAMGALQLPPGVLDALNSRRRAFLWTGSDKAAGANCLIAWEKVCTLKDDGGLGVRNLAAQNACLLLRLIHRLHNPDGSSWATWARERVSLHDLSGAVHGQHWSSLRDLLPAYRKISRVILGDGRSSDFWEDVWLDDKALSESYPALHSHVADKNTSIHHILQVGLPHTLQPRLSTQASLELATLLPVIQEVQLHDILDERVCCFEDESHRLLTGHIYRASVSAGGDSFLQKIWLSYVPPRVKFFGWLMVQDRIHSRVNLHKKSIVSEATCALCLTAEETTDHIMSSCPFAASFWNHVGAGLIHIAPVRELWDSSLPTNITQRSSPTFLLLCCWELWKHRNAVVFNGMPPSLSRLLAACRESANTWKCRVSVSKRHEFDSWCILFQM
jgi:hypothetical protein